MVNIGERVATVSIVFSTSKNSALVDRKMLQRTTLIKRLYPCTLSEQ